MKRYQEKKETFSPSRHQSLFSSFFLCSPFSLKYSVVLLLSPRVTVVALLFPALFRCSFFGSTGWFFRFFFPLRFQAVQRSVLCRSRRELSHEYLIFNSTYLQNLASIQPRTNRLKFADISNQPPLPGTQIPL